MFKPLLACLLVVAVTMPADGRARDYLKKSDEWFETAEAKRRLDNILTYQDTIGCWPKNMDTTEKPFEGAKEELHGTFDNSATVNELRLLARGYELTGDPRFQSAFMDGIKCILDAQYANGGWPQSPKPRDYSVYITYNDGTMIGLMTLLREVNDNRDDSYRFVPGKIRQRAGEAFDRGVQCILDCQIKVDGKLTVWCAQHDHQTLEPRGARSYEHPSLSGGESSGIVCLLMSLDEPSDDIRQSIRAAVDWFERSKLTGIRFDTTSGDGKIVADATASPLWARFYEIDTNRPIFSGRDGVIKYDVSEIEAERRNGYSWYGSYGKKVEECWSDWERK